MQYWFIDIANLFKVTQTQLTSEDSFEIIFCKVSETINLLISGDNGKELDIAILTY